jgi:hypothetical protein
MSDLYVAAGYYASPALNVDVLRPDYRFKSTGHNKSSVSNITLKSVQLAF